MMDEEYLRNLILRADAWRRPQFPSEASELIDALTSALESTLAGRE